MAKGLGVEEVEEEAVRAGDGLGELAVEGVGAVSPVAFAQLGGDKSSLLRLLAGVVGFGEGVVMGVPGA